MRTRGVGTAGGRKSRPYFSPGGAGIESTARNFVQPLRKRVADRKHGFESRWGHHLNLAHLPRLGFHPLPLASPVHLPSIVGDPIIAANDRAALAGEWSVGMGT